MDAATIAEIVAAFVVVVWWCSGLPIKPIVIRPMVKVSHHVSLFNPLRLWQPFDDAVGFHADADDAGEEF